MRIPLLAFSLLFYASTSLSQTSTSDCEGGIPLCGGIYSEETAPPGIGNVFEYTGACNQGNETMSLWYTFTVQQPGELSFILTPNNELDDYDWGLFEITNGGCAGINAQDGSSPEVSCNSQRRNRQQQWAGRHQWTSVQRQLASRNRTNLCAGSNELVQ